MIYLVCFAASGLLAYFADKTKKRSVFWILSVLSVAVPVILAGLRDYSIGIDVVHYLQWPEYWGGAISADSIWDYLQSFYAYGENETLFALLLGILAKATGEFRVFLFVAHAVIVGGIYIGAVRFRKYANPALVMVLFYLFFYPYSLNGIRQFMAMAMVFAALADIPERKYLRYCLVVLVASQIHFTALLAFLPLMIWVALYWGKILNTKDWMRPALLIGAMILLVVCFAPLCRLMISLGVLSKKYNFYLDGELTPARLITLLLVLELAAVAFYHRNILSQGSQVRYLVASSAAYLVLLQLSNVLVYGKRVAMYLALGNLVTIGILQHAPKSRLMRGVAALSIMAVALAYWWYLYVHHNASETYPYLFGV